jgi:hypothetical protein
MTIRSTYESIAIENDTDVREVDLVIAQIAFALLLIPPEFTNAREQPFNVFCRHSFLDIRVSLYLIPILL